MKVIQALLALFGLFVVVHAATIPESMELSSDTAQEEQDFGLESLPSDDEVTEAEAFMDGLEPMSEDEAAEVEDFMGDDDNDDYDGLVGLPSEGEVAGFDGGSVPFKLCSQDSFVVEDVSLNPNPPTKNGNLKITVTGDLKTKVEDGAKIQATVRVLGAKVNTLEYDVCKNIASCPLAPGKVSLSLDQWLDKRIPTLFKYTIRVKFLSKERKEMGCALLKVKIKKPHRAAAAIASTEDDESF